MRFASTYANRGAMTEQLIDWSNNQYREKGLARIDKIPTPIKILNIVRNKVTGFIEKKSTVDYVGLIPGGQFICFDAKETQEKNIFPLKNVHQHQMDYMDQVHNLGGKAFLIVSFVKYDQYFRLDYSVLKYYWERWKANPNKRGYASIPYEEFTALRQKLKSRNGIALDYLDAMIEEGF